MSLLFKESYERLVALLFRESYEQLVSLLFKEFVTSQPCLMSLLFEESVHNKTSRAHKYRRDILSVLEALKP